MGQGVCVLRALKKVPIGGVCLFGSRQTGPDEEACIGRVVDVVGGPECGPAVANVGVVVCITCGGAALP